MRIFRKAAREGQWTEATNGGTGIGSLAASLVRYALGGARLTSTFRFQPSHQMVADKSTCAADKSLHSNPRFNPCPNRPPPAL